MKACILLTIFSLARLISALICAKTQLSSASEFVTSKRETENEVTALVSLAQRFETESDISILGLLSKDRYSDCRRFYKHSFGLPFAMGLEQIGTIQLRFEFSAYLHNVREFAAMYNISCLPKPLWLLQSNVLQN